MTSTLSRPSGSPFEEIPVGGSALETFDFNNRTGNVAFEPVFRARPSGKLLTAIGLTALVITLLCAQAAYLIADAQPDVFAARSQVTYQGETWVETQSVAVKSPTLVGPIALAEGIPIDEFLANWDAGQVLGTQIIQFQYVSQDQDQALRIVQAVTDTYLADFEAIASAPDPLLESYLELMADLETSQASLEAQITDRLAINTGGNDPELTAMYQEKGQNDAAINTLRLQIAQRDLFRNDQAQPTLLTKPFKLTDPVAPLPAKRAIFGLLGGLALSTAFVFVALRLAAARR